MKLLKVTGRKNMKENNIKIEATGDFPFTFFIEKAIASGTKEMMTIKGVASTVNIDHDNERMSKESLDAMAEIINEKSVPLRVEHQKDDQSIVGSVNKAWVDERNQLWIEADLDKSHPGASMLYKALKTGAKLGLSVGGRVKHAIKEFSESAGKMVKTFYNVVLDEVSVTSRPANYDAWLVSKSIINKEEDGENFVDSPIYKEFLFESSGFDYMQAFAKSIPNNSWKKVDISKNNNNNNMKDVKKDSSETTEEETKTKAQDTETTETETKEKKEGGTKEDTTTEDTAFKSMVTKGLEGLTKMIAKLIKGTGDTTIMPDKTETETETKTKAQDTDTDTKTETETKTKTQNTETETKTGTESETKEKAEASSETEESKEKDSNYQIKSMKSILKKIEDLSKAIDESETETKEKTETKDESETTEKSLDKFVATLEKSVNDLQEKFEKGGKRFPGLTEMIVNSIRNDAEVQKEIKAMMAESGFKKSMNFGTPMMRTKDGKSYRLTATSIDEEVQKSKKDNAGKTFKDVYNKDFSSSANAGE